MRPELQVREECLGEAVDKAAARWGDAVGWLFEDRPVSFREMQESVDRVARAFLAAGVKRGEIVATWMPNRAEFVEIEFALAKIGAIVVAINTRFKSFELAHILKRSGAVMLIMEERFLKHDYAAVLRELSISPGGAAPDFPQLRSLVSLARPASPGFVSWDDFVAGGAAVPRSALAERQRACRWSEAVILQYTSGTTAAPKGALLNHRYVLNVGQFVFGMMGVREGEAVLNTQPIYHIGGSCSAVPAPLSLGCRMVIPEFYEAGRVLELIERERCVARTGFPAMYIMEMDHPRFPQTDLSSLRTGWSGGTPEFLKKVSEAFGIPGLMLTFSSTEVGGTGSWYDDPWEQRTTSAGRPLPGTELMIADPETGKEVPAGQHGEILMRGWWQMNGYLGDPVETAKAIDSQGWSHTGDLGYVDETGCLHFVGRIKDMLKVGGENVSAEEVEGVLVSHPAIRQAAIIGMPDPRLEEVPLAVVELQPGAKLTESEIIDYCAERMANFRVPRAVRFVTAWPLTGSGKIMKYALRETLLPKAPQSVASVG